MSGVSKKKKRGCEYCHYLTTGCHCRLYDRQISYSIWFERGCQHFEELKQTVFEKITESVETLAEKLVYESTTCDSDGHVLFGYRSTLITNGFWFNKPEAIAATIEKLKKEWKK